MLTADTDRSQPAGTTVVAAARHRVVRSGVWPALAAWGFAGALAVGVADLRPSDLLAFTVYVVGFLTLPGVLVWRRVAADPAWTSRASTWP